MRASLGPALCALGVVAMPVVLAGCGSQYAGSTVGQQVESWATTSPDPKFAAAMSTLQGDLNRIAKTQSASDAAALRTDCEVLVTDALSANQNLPTPDTELTDVLSKAYTAAAGAGRDCLCAAGSQPCPAGAHGKADLLATSDAESAAALRGFIAAEARVDLLLAMSGGRQ